MKDIINKKFWVIYFVLNLASVLIYAAFAFLRYELVLGDLVGIISFLIFIGSIFLVFKIAFNGKTNLSTKSSRIGIVFLFLVFAILNLGIIALFIFFNYLYKKSHSQGNIAFAPFNLITMMTPYVILSFQIIVLGVSEYIKTRLLEKKKRREENGQII